MYRFFVAKNIKKCYNNLVNIQEKMWIIMEVSKHAKKRIRERINVPQASADRMAKKAISNGLSHSETTGQLRKYLDKLYLSHGTASNMRVYNEKVFLFSKDMVLITVIPLSNNLKKIANKNNGRKKRA